MRRILPLLPVLIALALPAVAVSKPLVGIGDQHVQMFGDKRFQKLHLQLTRIAIPWDWYRNPSYVTFLDQWVAAARADNLKPLVAFTREWDANGAHYRVPVYKLEAAFLAVRARYPDISDFTPWNEANHPSQPTWRDPALVARYYKALHGECPHFCHITAADVLDTNTAPAWLAKFQRYVHNGRLWGLHSYKDPNNGTVGHLRDVMRAVKGQVWFTETGGIKRLKPDPGSKGLGRTNSLKGQALAVKRVFALAKSYPTRLKRIYFYQWQEDPTARWDSAFTDRHGKLRPAYTALRQGL